MEAICRARQTIRGQQSDAGMLVDRPGTSVRRGRDETES